MLGTHSCANAQALALEVIMAIVQNASWHGLCTRGSVQSVPDIICSFSNKKLEVKKL